MNKLKLIPVFVLAFIALEVSAQNVQLHYGAILLGIIISMPITYSISNGILIGMISYVLMNMICGNFKKITPVMYILAVLFILK